MFEAVNEVEQFWSSNNYIVDNITDCKGSYKTILCGYANVGEE